jgi:cyanophycin synthetase
MILRFLYLLRRFTLSARRNRRQALIDRIRDQFYVQCWKEAAEATGSTLVPVDENYFRVVHGGGSRDVCVSRNLNPLDSGATLALADNKMASYRLLEQAEIPTPEHVVLRSSDKQAALDFLKSAKGCVVVKPAAGTGGGAGVTTGVATPSQLRHAMAWAGAYNDKVIVERNVGGETFRLVYLDGKLLDCVMRRSPRLVGDGILTVQKLVDQENKRRLEEGFKRAQSLLGVDCDMKATLAAQGLGLGSVPANGWQFKVKRVVNDNIGAENISMAHLLCDAVINTGRTVANIFGLRLVGIDVITTDPSLPLRETSGAVIDVNGDPGFYYHYYKNEGRVPLAEHILREAIATCVSIDMRVNSSTLLNDRRAPQPLAAQGGFP